MIPMIPKMTLQIAPSDDPAGEQRSISGASAAKLSRVVKIRGRRHRIALYEAVEEGGKRFKDTTVAPTILQNWPFGENVKRLSLFQDET
jgi:hypothetical protein